VCRPLYASQPSLQKFSYELGLPLEVAYIKSTSQAQDLLYTYDAISRLYDAQVPDRNEMGLDFGNYIRLGPLGRAIARAQYRRRSVVLIDEIDKADIDFPNDLLWELDRLEFRIEGPFRKAEEAITYTVPEDEISLRPIVFITHNEEKALPGPFLRRCIYHYVTFPDNIDDLLRILRVQQIQDMELSRRAIQVLLNLRQREELTKKPGLSELLDWVGYLEAKEVLPEGIDPENVSELVYMDALLKQHADQQRVRSMKPA
jgi:MoxR-like ATPase